MKNNDTNIENLFATLQKQSTNNEESFDWQQLQPKLRRQNFMRFGVRHFNIYYSATILLAIIGLVYLFTPSHHNTNNTQQENKIQIQTNQPAKPQINTNHPTENTPYQQNTGHKPTITNNTSKPDKQKTAHHNSTPTNQNAVAAKTDSVVKIQPTQPAIAQPDSTPQNSTATQSQPAAPATAPKAARKVVYQTQTDTVTSVDTIKQEKRRRRGLFSK